MPTDGLERFISITFALLLFSQLSERVASMVKLYLPALNTRSVDETRERKRELRIYLVSLIVGIVVAFIARASLFSILGDPNFVQRLFWSGEAGPSGDNILREIVGCLLAGVVFSFGSKFWHDMLDFLYEAKSLKRQLKEDISPATSQASAAGSGSAPPDIDGDTIERVLAEHRAELMAYDNVEGVGVGMKMVGGAPVKCIVVHVREKVRERERVEGLRGSGQYIPETIAVTLPGGREIQVPVDVVESGKAVVATRSLFPAGQIANAAPVDNALGTFGCRVRRGDKQYMLTCYHVVKHRDHAWKKFKAKGDGAEKVVHPLNGEHVADLVEAAFDDELDAALLEPVAGVTISNHIPPIGPPAGSRSVFWWDIRSTPVRFEGAVSGGAGIIIDKNFTRRIEFPDGTVHVLSNLITASTTDNRPLALLGDSGAILMDSNNAALGMIVAVDSNVAYVIPMKTILNRFQVQLA